MSCQLMRRLPANLAIALSCVGGLCAASAQAGDLSDRFDVHGYGFQSYAQASANAYLGADKHGTWDNNFLGLVVAATLTDQSKLWAQLEDTSGGGARFTWAFVDYQVNDALRVHVGRVKLPLGFYNEIINAKSLQPSALEPALYQRAADMVHDAYHGVGVDYEQDLGGGHLLWQGFGGNVYDVDPPVDSRDRRAFGGRLTYRTPIDGLRLILSGYRTQVEKLADHTMSNEDRAIVSAEFVRDAWDLKAEYGTHKFVGVSSYAYYVQGAYTVAEKWTPYVRYDYVTTDKSQRKDSSFSQKTVAVGLGYKVGANIGLKVENHFNNGYALPVASGEVAQGAGTRKWNLFFAAADFAF